MGATELFYLVIDGELAGMTLYDLLRYRLHVSRNLLRRLRVNNGILLNGQVASTTKVKLNQGDEVRVVLSETTDHPVAPEPGPLQIVYEDEDVLVLDKPAGIVVHPTGGYFSGTLGNYIAHYLQSLGKSPVVHPVNRLDRTTSGLVIFAKNPWIHDQLTRKDRPNLVRRVYSAVVEGRVLADEGVIKNPIGISPVSSSWRVVAAEGKPAVTRYRVVRRYNKFTLLSIQLETGRTHQIRVHMQHIGHPLLGDPVYGRPHPLLQRPALHAARLWIHHPRTGLILSFYSTMPAEFDAVLSTLIG